MSKSVSDSDWKRDAGKKAAAFSFSLRVLMLVLPVRPVDEKLLPDSASSVSGTYKWKDENQCQLPGNTSTVDIRTDSILI